MGKYKKKIKKQKHQRKRRGILKIKALRKKLKDPTGKSGKSVSQKKGNAHLPDFLSKRVDRQRAFGTG